MAARTLRAHPRQLEMAAIVEAPLRPVVCTWGGRREGAGRKPLTDAQRSRRRRPLAHRARAVHKKRHPVHVTLRARAGVPSFRAQRVHQLLVGILERQSKRAYRDDFHVVHYSIQSNHLHVIIETTDKRTMRSGVSGLVIAFAKRLNKEILAGRTGKVWGDRYHAHELASPREVRNALAYVYNNYKKHGYVTYGCGVVAPYSSALLFDKWTEDVITMPTDPRPPDKPRTWLLGEGWWTKHGRLHPNELPRDARG